MKNKLTKSLIVFILLIGTRCVSAMPQLAIANSPARRSRAGITANEARLNAHVRQIQRGQAERARQQKEDQADENNQTLKAAIQKTLKSAIDYVQPQEDQDFEAAHRLLLIVASQDFDKQTQAEAQYALGELHYKNLIDNPDKNKVRELWELSLITPHKHIMKAKFGLGTILLEESPDKALEYFEEVALQTDDIQMQVAAKHIAAQLYIHGVDAPQDLDTAGQYIRDIQGDAQFKTPKGKVEIKKLLGELIAARKKQQPTTAGAGAAAAAAGNAAGHSNKPGKDFQQQVEQSQMKLTAVRAALDQQTLDLMRLITLADAMPDGPERERAIASNLQRAEELQIQIKELNRLEAELKALPTKKG